MTTEFVLEGSLNGQITGLYYFAFADWEGRDCALRAACDMSEALYEQGEDVFWREQ